jgi:protein-tyrosine kinase
MSKIAKALEKARTNLEDFRPAQTARVPEVKDLRVIPQDIHEPLVYTQTQVVRPAYDTLEENRIVTFFNDQALLNDYNLLRTQVYKRLGDPSRNTIMITSVNRGEGKSVTAINLAFSIAREVQKSVLLVDMNLRYPKLQEYLGLGRRLGLSDHLLRNKPMPELLVNPGLDKIVVLPGGEPIQDSAEIMGSAKVRDLVREFKMRYKNRYIIFDCPHILNMPDAIVFSSLVDAVILVIEASKTSKEEIQQALSLLDGGNLLGIVMNKTRYS